MLYYSKAILISLALLLCKILVKIASSGFSWIIEFQKVLSNPWCGFRLSTSTYFFYKIK